MSSVCFFFSLGILLEPLLYLHISLYVYIGSLKMNAVFQFKEPNATKPNQEIRNIYLPSFSTLLYIK